MEKKTNNTTEDIFKLFMSFNPKTKKVIAYTSASVVLILISPHIMKTMSKIILSYKDLTNAIKS